jgi:hypothetical protein
VVESGTVVFRACKKMICVDFLLAGKSGIECGLDGSVNFCARKSLGGGAHPIQIESYRVALASLQLDREDFLSRG